MQVYAHGASAMLMMDLCVKEKKKVRQKKWCSLHGGLELQHMPFQRPSVADKQLYFAADAASPPADDAASSLGLGTDGFLWQ